MARPRTQRATTLSISLTPELAAAIARRIESGLYSSASELIREALRRFLGAGQPEPQPVRGGASLAAEPSANWQVSEELVALGEELRAARERRATDAQDADRLRRLTQAQDDLEGDAVIRPSPARLRKLLDGNSS